MSKIKLCWWCKHFEFNGGSPAYSQWTPGTDASIHCKKDCYDKDFVIWHLYDADDLRRLIEKAETCPHFESKIVEEKWRRTETSKNEN